MPVATSSVTGTRPSGAVASAAACGASAAGGVSGSSPNTPRHTPRRRLRQSEPTPLSEEMMPMDFESEIDFQSAV